MLVNKAYKFRLYPNQNQKELINKTFGSTRLIYNYYLDKKIKEYKENKNNLSCYDCIKDLKNLYIEYPFLKEVDSIAIRCSLFDLDNAYQKFFQEKIGYPKFKSKFNKNSFRTNMVTSEYKGNTYYNIKLDLINKTITWIYVKFLDTNFRTILTVFKFIPIPLLVMGPQPSFIT